LLYFFALKCVKISENRGKVALEQDIEFSVKIKEEDLYRFNLHHTYTSTQGIFSIVLFVLLIAVWIMRFTHLSPMYQLMYPLIAIIFVSYLPLTLKFRAKTQMTQEVFKYPLTYKFTEMGLVVTSPASEAPAELPWEYIYKVSTWKGYLLIYSSRINAYIIPSADIKNQYDSVIAFIKSHLEDYKLQIQ